MPKVNGKEYPYTAAGKAAAEKEMKKRKKATPSKKNEKMKEMPKPRVSGSATTKSMPGKAMNKAIPGNPGINLGSAAKKFVMSMPPVMAARGAAKVGMAAGKAIGNTMNPPARQMKRMPGTLGDRIVGRPAPVVPKRKPKPLFPKKPGR
jgi:hypothetical protein